MLDNFKIGIRLALGFGVILLLLVTLWGINHWANSHVSGVVDKAFNGTVKSMELALRVRAITLELRRDEKDAFLNIGTPAAEKYLEKWRANHEKLGARVAMLDKNIDLPEDKATLQVMKNDLDVYAKGFQQVISKMQSGEISTPQQANAAVAPFKEATHRLMKNAEELAAGFVRRTDADYGQLEQVERKFKLSVDAITIGALLLGIGMAMWIRHSINHPIGQLQTVISDVGQTGDLTLTRIFHSPHASSQVGGRRQGKRLKNGDLPNI